MENYFARVAQEVFTDLMFKLKFEVPELHESSVIYSSATSYVDVRELERFGPRAYPILSIGCIPYLSMMERDREVPINGLIAKNMNWTSIYGSLMYNDESTCRAKLEILRDDYFLTFGLNYIDNFEKLKEKIAENSAERANYYSDIISKARFDIARADAKLCWHERNYEKYIEDLSIIPSGELSESENMKIEYAKRKLGKQ